MIMFSLIPSSSHLMTQLVTEVGRLFPVKVHINSFEVTLIIVPIKEALELHKYFVQAVRSLASRVWFASAAT
jgi:hypothetical protein